MAHVLIFERDNEVRRLMCLVLREAGHHIVAEVGSATKLALVQPTSRRLVDFILCDVGFLDTSDLARVAELKGLFPDVAIIGTSAAGHSTDPGLLAETTSQVGLVALVSKPFSIDELLQAVRQAQQ